jgi:hypothetical protein
MEASKAETETPAIQQRLTGALARASQLSDRLRDGRPVCWECGSAGHLRGDRRRGPCEGDQDLENE